MHCAILAAQELDIDHLYVNCHAFNRPMQRIAERFAAKMSFEEGECFADIAVNWDPIPSILATHTGSDGILALNLWAERAVAIGRQRYGMECTMIDHIEKAKEIQAMLSKLTATERQQLIEMLIRTYGTEADIVELLGSGPLDGVIRVGIDAGESPSGVA
jgi:hypothetical protein